MRETEREEKLWSELTRSLTYKPKNLISNIFIFQPHIRPSKVPIWSSLDDRYFPANLVAESQDQAIKSVIKPDRILHLWQLHRMSKVLNWNPRAPGRFPSVHIARIRSQGCHLRHESSRPNPISLLSILSDLDCLTGWDLFPISSSFFSNYATPLGKLSRPFKVL